jgi:type I restriction enzyme S subunit
MVGEWRSSTWGEEISLEYGKALRGHEVATGKYRVFGSNGPIGWTTESLAPGPGVILGRKGAYRGVQYSPGPFYVIDTAYYVAPKTELDMRWLYYAIQHYKLGEVDDGSPIPSTTRAAVYVRDLAVPPPDEQRAIAHILGTLDDKIELNRRMNETLETMARALFKSWFVDFDPVRAKAEGRDPGLPQSLAALFPAHLASSELGEIPEGWRIINLPEEIDFLEGPGLRNWQYRDAGMKFLNIRCIIDGDFDLAKANAISLEEFEKKYSHFALREDDIVISTSGTLGRVGIARLDHLPVMLNTSVIRMRGREPFGLAYVWGFLQSVYFLEEMFALAAGSVQLNFGPMHLKRIKALRPPDEILKNFETIAQPIIRKALYNRCQSRTLAALRATLLPKLISGELRVKHSEQSIREVTA